jgi:hypothetical protein
MGRKECYINKRPLQSDLRALILLGLFTYFRRHTNYDRKRYNKPNIN